MIERVSGEEVFGMNLKLGVVNLHTVFLYIYLHWQHPLVQEKLIGVWQVCEIWGISMSSVLRSKVHRQRRLLAAVTLLHLGHAYQLYTETWPCFTTKAEYVLACLRSPGSKGCCQVEVDVEVLMKTVCKLTTPMNFNFVQKQFTHRNPSSMHECVLDMNVIIH